MDKLKECPFCGGEGAIKTRYIGYGSLGLGSPNEYRVVCKDCRTSSNEHRAKEETIAAWNRRAQPEHKPSPHREKLLQAICDERARQDAKWGFPQENTYSEWAGILGEECGEAIAELNELNFGRGNRNRMITEAIHTAAVALSIIEHVDITEAVTAARRGIQPKPEKSDNAKR